jgi:hypothetical protein
MPIGNILSTLSVMGNNRRKFLVIISIVFCSLITDISLSNISDVVSLSTSWGFAVFIAIAIVYAVTQYLILEFVKEKSKTIRMKSPHFNKLITVMTIVQYILVAIIILIILEMFVKSFYYTYTLNLSLSISYTSASILMVLLAIKFFSWNRSNKSFIVLLYGISSLIITISIVSSLVFFNVILLGMPAQISPPSNLTNQQKEVSHGTAEQKEIGHGTAEQKEIGHGPDIRKFDPGTILGLVQTVFATSQIVSFLLLLGSSALLLHIYSEKIGKVKFWIIINIPLVSFLSIFVIVTPHVLNLSNSREMDTIFKIIVDAIGYTLPAIASSILFGLPFWMTARSFAYSSILKDYMIIAGCGLALFELATTGNVILASYPPFGLASVSLVGLSSYMILMGIYSSAISVSQDVKLRQSIRKFAMKESRLLDSIGIAQMEQEIESRVIAMTIKSQDIMTEESGVYSSLNEAEVKQYLDIVLQEIKESKRGNNTWQMR